MYIKAYSEYMAYPGIFRTVDIFSQFQARYSGFTQEQFMHILNLLGRFRYIWNSGLFRYVIFFPYSGIFRTLEYVIKQYFMQNQTFSNLERKMSYLCNFGL